MKSPFLILLLLLGMTAALSTGCSTRLYLPEGRYLLKGEPDFRRLDGNKAMGSLDSMFVLRRDSLRFTRLMDDLKRLGHSTLDDDILYSAVRTHPNRKMLIVKTYLHLYNLGKSLQIYEYPPERVYKFFFPRGKLVGRIADLLVNTAGEPPVLVDSLLLEKDAENLRSVYFSRGFFHARASWVMDTCTARMNRQKARVSFLIEEGQGYIIDTVIWETRHAAVQDSLLATAAESFLVPGDLYNEEKLTQERARISELMRKHGYFTFSPSMVSMEVDTHPQVNHHRKPLNPALTRVRPLAIRILVEDTTQKFFIRKVRFHLEPPSLRPEDYTVLLRGDMVRDSFFKELGMHTYLLSEDNPVEWVVYSSELNGLNLDFLADQLSLKAGDYYSLENERKTQNRLQALGIFRYALIKYEPLPGDDELDVVITAKLERKYALKAGIEGFSRNDPFLQSNLPGVGGEVSLRDKFLFKGAERLDALAKGNVSFFFAGTDSTGIDSVETFYEYGIRISYTAPRIDPPLPFRFNRPSRNPTTTLALNLNAQRITDLTRRSVGANWTYSWNHSSYSQRARSSLSPYIINYIRSTVGDSLRSRLQASGDDALASFIALDLKSRFSTRFSYKFTYSNYMSTRRTPTWLLQPIFEFGGNTPWLIDRYANLDGSYRDGYIHPPVLTDTIQYGQFIKTAVEYKHFFPLGRGAEFVCRGYAGFATPWNGSRQVPFDSRFYAGGINSLRGWQSNTLGPGTYDRTEDGTLNGYEFLVSPGGDIAFEVNAELRFNVYKYLELALFSDAGNVWFLPWSQFDLEGSAISKTNFYKLGWDAGIGFRFDFSFFVFRVDMAQQIYAPDVDEFVVKSGFENLGTRRFQVNFGIGYPF